ncbi:MAG: sulfotransferase domain-containing protein [Coleofasciculus sp. G3-WIS-01]|uniref:sulfotransferase domain-containing protein n=1 Tax=Coleofasciculus sp. G3-WIS-01 TaxID=3069528 RepID=UPI0032F829E9
MRLPDFLIIGAAKAGTTTLYKYLCRHSQFYQPAPENTAYVPQKPYSYKEPNFFGCDENYAKGINYYASLFTEAQVHQVCGEASTDYTKYPQFPESAARIAHHCPDVKLIYIMRHPVDRAYSYYVHLNRTNRKLNFQETFEEHLQKTTVSLDGSDYMLQIEQYLKFFSKEAFLFLLMDDLVQQPQDTLKKTFNFIGIDDGIDVISGNEIAENKASQYLENIYRSKLSVPLRKIPGANSMRMLLPQSWRDQIYYLLRKTAYGEQVKKQAYPQPMLPETRKMLLERFQEPNQRLSEFLNRDLSHWSR